jgi:glycerol-3-phosphate acyltransferase PlsY
MERRDRHRIMLADRRELRTLRLRATISDMDAAAAGAAAVAAGYLIGSVPMARLLTGRDLRTVGDRNPGYWNAKETLGRRAALPVFVADAAKGAVAAGIGRWLGDDRWWVAVLAVGAAMIGHAWPIFARFRGGRSVLAWAGGVVVISPWTGLAAVIVVAVMWAISRSFAWAARAGIIAYPIAQLSVDGPHRTAATGALMCIFGLRFVQAWRSDAR